MVLIAEFHCILFFFVFVFVFLAQNLDIRRGGSNKNPQSMFGAKSKGNITNFQLKKKPLSESHESYHCIVQEYSKIPTLRPPLGLSKSGLKVHFWTVPKVVSNQMFIECRK